MPVEAGQPMIRAGIDIRYFEQTPSQVGGNTGSQLAPHTLFHLFTAGIILEQKVFVR